MYSLQAIKHMTTVDGGMLTCRNPDDLAIGRRLHWFGIDRTAPRTEVDIKTVGYKYHTRRRKELCRRRHKAHRFGWEVS